MEVNTWQHVLAIRAQRTRLPFPLSRAPVAGRGGQVQQQQQRRAAYGELPLGLFVRLQAAEMSRAGAGVHMNGWAANVIATTFDCLADAAAVAATATATAASMSMGHAKESRLLLQIGE